MMRASFLCVLILGAVTPARAQVMERERADGLRATLPQLEAREWHEDLHSPAVMWFTRDEIPPAYQHQGTFHSPAYNISADPTDTNIRHGEGGNANVQFPWARAGGLDRSPEAITATGLLLPARPNGGRWPVVVWSDDLPGDPRVGPEPGLRWMFPAGATLFEVLGHEVAGKVTVFEVRARVRELDAWGVGLFRPYPRAEDLAAELARRDAVRHAATIAALRRPPAFVTVDVSDRANKSRPAFIGLTDVTFLPTLPPELVRELLRVPFRDALGAVWLTSASGAKCYSPTTAELEQLVPRHWMGSLVGTDSDSCAKCHDTVGQHARRFDQFRGWYGHVRGDDFVFSFHPVAPSAIAYNGARLSARLNPALVRSGVVEVYDPARHPRAVYQLLSWPARRRP